jgi:cyclophilin family peptidyl-prolyl cis-trans isomerase
MTTWNLNGIENAEMADLYDAEVQKWQMKRKNGVHAQKSGFFLLVLFLAAPFSLFSQPSKAPTLVTSTHSAAIAEKLVLSAPAMSTEELEELQAVLETSKGDIVIQFYPEKAPDHVRYFTGLVKSGFYNGTTFHRVILRGIVQGGDPLSKDPAKKGLYGTGGLKKLKPEFNDTPHKRGTVSAVLLPGDPNSAGSQFFICVSDQPQLDRQYTAWGYVVEGMDVVDKISAVPASSNQLALERVEIKRVSLRPIPPPMPIPFSGTSKEELKTFRVRLETSLGSILIELSPDVALEACRNFLKLSKVGLYDGTTWHRVVPGFVIQGGDLSTRTTSINSEQMSKYVKNLQPEFSDVKHVKGTVSMARSDALDSASTSFFICLADEPSLDGKYTAFGKVIEGIEVVDKIAAVQLDGEKPKERVELIRAVVEEVKK